MADPNIAERARAEGAEQAASAIRHACEHLPAPERSSEFGSFFDRFGSARVVLLGEATHGTSEFYNARAAITRRLIEQHGFSVVAVEADWPDANRVDRHVRHRGPGKYDEECFARFPTWMWRNEEVQTFLEWLRLHNETLPRDKRVEFRGLDVYSLRASIAEVLDLPRSRRSRGGQSSTPALRLSHAVASGPRLVWARGAARRTRPLRRCRGGAIAGHPRQAAAILRARTARTYLDAAQNARIVLAAEQYYRIMYRGSTESWNLRDRHMFDTLQMSWTHGGRTPKLSSGRTTRISATLPRRRWVGRVSSISASFAKRPMGKKRH